MTQVNILIADDHEVIRDGVKALLEKNPGLTVVGEAADGFEAIEKAKVLNPDVILLDISMPRMNGMDAAQEIHAANPKTKIIILSMHVDADHITRCIEMDVMGYVVKTHGGKEIINAIEAVMAGRKFYSDIVTDTILEKYKEQRVLEVTKKAKPAIELTSREKEIITFISEGLTNQKIADKLFLSFRTIETHRANLMRKLDAKNSIELVNKARAHHLIQ